MTLKRRFFSAPTLTQALLSAARHHAVDPDDLAHKVIEKKHGFIKAPRGVVIEVDPDAPTRATEETQATPARGDVHPALGPATAAPAAKTTEVPFEPARGEDPADHPALASVASTGEPAREPDTGAEPEAAAEPEIPTWPEGPARATESTESEQPVAREEVREVPEAEEALEVEPPPASDSAEPDPGDAASEQADVDRAAKAPVGADRESVEPEIEVDEPSPAQDAASVPQSEPAPQAPVGAEEPPLDDGALREAVAEAVDELAFLASLRVQVARVESGDEGLEVELEGPDSSRLAARGGRSLLAMQHLLPRLLFGRLGRALRCHLDCDGFHAARSERIDNLAQKAAERVRSGGRSWLLEPMAPDERRLVHLALAEVPDIETESVGQGFLKRVRVAQTGQA